MVGIVQFKGEGNHERNDLYGTEELGARNNRGCVCVWIEKRNVVKKRGRGGKNGKERLKEIAMGIVDPVEKEKWKRKRMKV